MGKEVCICINYSIICDIDMLEKDWFYFYVILYYVFVMVWEWDDFFIFIYKVKKNNNVNNGVCFFDCVIFLYMLNF